MNGISGAAEAEEALEAAATTPVSCQRTSTRFSFLDRP
jgi:hypothetical protein